jgi:uncharacterized protein (TIGR00251 family)
LKIEIFVKTSKRESRLIKIGEGTYDVSLKAPREKGKANTELIKLLSKHFKGKVKIISGFTSKHKFVEIINPQ